jgi:hypothetical protein
MYLKTSQELQGQKAEIYMKYFLKCFDKIMAYKGRVALQ